MVGKNMKKYYWIIGVIFVILIIFVLSIVFIINPSLQGIDKVNKELKESKEELKNTENKLAKLKELKVQEKDLRNETRIVYRAIPTRKEVGDIFIQLNELAGEAGGIRKKSSDKNNSTLSGSSTATPSTISGVGSLTYNGEVTFPGFNNLKTLLEKSEKALRFVHLNNFKINTKDDLTVNLTFTAYYRNEDSTILDPSIIEGIFEDATSVSNNSVTEEAQPPNNSSE